MKSILHLKFIALYIIFGFLCVFTTAMLAEELIQNQLEEDTSRTLYRRSHSDRKRLSAVLFFGLFLRPVCPGSARCHETLSGLLAVVCFQ